MVYIDGPGGKFVEQKQFDMCTKLYITPSCDVDNTAGDCNFLC